MIPAPDVVPARGYFARQRKTSILYEPDYQSDEKYGIISALNIKE